VREAAVVGRPHPEWGEEVVAFVVMQKGVDIDPVALDVLCLENIARFKRPKSYLAIDELPKNNYGKVVKVALRERLQT
jgi:long-chain acyl-CoA synthetase